MREFVGVKSPFDLMIEVGSKKLPIDRIFKRESLMFHRIACPQLGQLLLAFERLGTLAQPLSDELCAHVDYLKAKGVIFDDVSSATGPKSGLLMSDISFHSLNMAQAPFSRAVIEGIQGAGLEDVIKNDNLTVDEMMPYLDDVPPIIGPLVLMFQLEIRKICIQLRLLDSVEAYPVFSEILPGAPTQSPKKGDVVEVAIKALPVPADNVPWEQIVEYRNDPESKAKFLALRHWMTKMARTEIPAVELEEELEYLLQQYQQHMNLHRLKTNSGTIETIIITSADVLGNLLSFRWGKVAQALFSIKHRQEALLEGELTAPGKEVAYIVKARETFGVAS